jgi:hypothetical protein
MDNYQATDNSGNQYDMVGSTGGGSGNGSWSRQMNNNHLPGFNNDDQFNGPLNIPQTVATPSFTQLSIPQHGLKVNFNK